MWLIYVMDDRSSPSMADLGCEHSSAICVFNFFQFDFLFFSISLRKK